ncbi:MAG: hypothetical protein ABJP34_01295 [Erythrobacter sp.]
MMISFFAAPILSLGLIAMQAAPQTGDVPADQSAQTARLTLEQTTSLRCSAAFALVSYGQSQGNADALKWPVKEAPAREFFVRTTANVMDETGLSREAVTEKLAAEAQKLIDNNALEKVMPACLLMLEGAGL